MPKAIIEIDDVDGVVGVDVFYAADDDRLELVPDSKAHMTAQLIMSYLDKILAPMPSMPAVGDVVAHEVPKSMIKLPVPKFIQAVRGH